MGLGADIKVALDALSGADKGDMAKCWDAIGEVIEESEIALTDFIGIVKMYKGTGINTPDTRTEAIGFRGGDTVPERPGWYVCNGQSGTPDLRNRFIRCESVTGNTGGSDNAIVVEHGHTAGNQSASHYHYHDHGSFNSGYSNPSHGHTFRWYQFGPEYAGGYMTSNNANLLYKNIYNKSAASAVVASGLNHRHSVDVPAKNSNNQNASHTHTVNNSGSSGTGANKPAYYSLIFIIRIS